MRKFFLFLPLLAALAAPAEDQARSRFLHLYYEGRYQEAHQELPASIHGDTEKQVWDERLHVQADIPGCAMHRDATDSVRGLALLRIGRFEEGRECLGEDWLSEYGRALLDSWEHRPGDAWDAIRRAMKLDPDNPDLVYLAADLAPQKEITLDLFQHFLELPSEDIYRKSVAEYALEFMKKTWSMELNVPNYLDGVEEIDSQYRNGQLIIRGRINENDRVSLLLDTGSSGMTLKDRDWHPQLVSDMMSVGIGKKQVNQGTRVVLSLFDSGRYRLKNPVAGVNASMPLDGAEGIIGPNLFANHYLLIPLRDNRKFTLFTCDGISDGLSCMASRGIQYKEQLTVPYYSINGLMILKGRVRNSPDSLDMLLDTGAAHCILSAATAKQYTRINLPLSKEVSSKSGMAGVGGSTSDLLVAENVGIEVGSIGKEFNRMIALNLADSSEALGVEMDVILGRDFLEGYTLLIDSRNHKVTFLK